MYKFTKIWHAICRGCSEVCLMAATLSVLGRIALIARASAVRMSDAVIYQAAAAAMVEPIATRSTNASGRKPLSAACTVDRGSVVTVIFHRTPAGFQPPAGYAACKIGLTVTSCLAPIKSVTAVIGLSETPAAVSPRKGL